MPVFQLNPYIHLGKSLASFSERERKASSYFSYCSSFNCELYLNLAVSVQSKEYGVLVTFTATGVKVQVLIATVSANAPQLEPDLHGIVSVASLFEREMNSL